MPSTVETICVDIGNSGMRCVRVSGSSALSPTAHVPWLGEVLRVDWSGKLARDGGAHIDEQAVIASMLAALRPWLATGVGQTTQPTVTQFSEMKPAVQRRWLVSSVQRSMEAALRSCVSELGAYDYRLVTHCDLKLEIAVEYPDQVGVDRLLAASAAQEASPGRSLIVIQAGSAITVDWIEPPRRYCGGAILPGVPMMLRLLSHAADLLPEVAARELFELPSLPGKNTSAAMTLGVSSAVVGGVQHLIERYRQRHGSDTLVVLSGGDGPRLTPHIAQPVQVIDHLVLRGLARLAVSENV